MKVKTYIWCLMLAATYTYISNERLAEYITYLNFIFTTCILHILYNLQKSRSDHDNCSEEDLLLDVTRNSVSLFCLKCGKVNKDVPIRSNVKGNKHEKDE